MTKKQINAQINKYNGYIDSNNANINSLNSKYQELEYVRQKLYESHSKLGEFRNAGKSKINSLKNRVANVKFVHSFSDAITNYADGAEASNAHGNIDCAIQSTNDKMNNLINDIQYLESENANYENKISNLSYQLKKAKE